MSTCDPLNAAVTLEPTHRATVKASEDWQVREEV